MEIRIFYVLVVLRALTTANSLRSDYGYETYMSDWGGGESPDWATLNGRSQPPKCVDIPANLTLCQNIGYKQMRIPNLLGHDSLREVTQQAGSWMALSNINCHGDTKLFLCSLFSPVCLDRDIWPCRSLCESVKSGCESRMNSYGFPWPEMVRCNKFPDNDMCIQAQAGNKIDERICAPCREPDTFEGIVDNFCRADFVVKIRIKKSSPVGDDTVIQIKKKKKWFKKQNMAPSDLSQMNFLLKTGSKCDCARLQGQQKDNYLIMGKNVGGKLTLSFGMKWEKKNKALKKAIKATRQPAICKGGAAVLKATDSNNQKPTKKGSGKKGKKGRKGKKGKKGRRKGRKGKKGKKKNKKRKKGKKGRKGKLNKNKPSSSPNPSVVDVVFRRRRDISSV